MCAEGQTPVVRAHEREPGTSPHGEAGGERAAVVPELQALIFSVN